MTPATTVAWILLVAMFAVPPVGLTALGARRRGARWPLMLVAGVCFPVTWTLWYLRDEHPYRPPGHRAL